MNLLAKVVIALVAGTFIGIRIIERDTHFLAVSQRRAIALFNDTFACRAQACLQRIHPFTPALHARNICVHDEQTSADWHWSADELSVRSAWLSALKKKVAPLSIAARGITIYSKWDNGLALWPHLQKMFFENSPIPIALQRITVEAITAVIHDPMRAMLLRLQGDLQVKAAGPHTQIQLKIRDGAWWYQGTRVCTALTASTTIVHDAEGTNVQLTGTVLVPAIDSTRACQITVRTHQQQLIVQLHDGAGDVLITATYDISHDTVHICGALPLAVLHPFVPQLSTLSVAGRVSFEATITQVTGALSMTGTISHAVGGRYAITVSNKADTTIITAKPLEIPAFMRNAFAFAQNTQLVMHWKQGSLAVLQVQAPCVYKKRTAIALALRAQRTATHTQAHMNIGPCRINATFDAHGVLTQGALLYNKNVIAPLHYDARTATYSADIDLQSFKVHGVGKVRVGYSHAHPTQLRVQLLDGHIPIPGIYNIIRAFDGTITADPTNGSIVVAVPEITCHQGTARIEATVHIDEHDTWVRGIAQGMHLLVNYKKDFFGLLSGTLMGQYRAGRASLSTAFLVDEGQYNKNIFAGFFVRERALRYPAWYDRVRAIPCTIDGRVTTREAVRVDTSLLEGAIHAQMHMHGQLSDAPLEGTIQLAQGTLKFPACPLALSYGSVTLKPHELSNPHIAFEAKGLFKKHSLLLRAQGTVQNPTLLFESTPPLSQEQIITLLLAGSEDGSLLLMMPTLIMGQMQQLLFGPEQTQTRLDSFFKGLLSPLKRMRLVPSFFDQTGRGGFRGKIDVDVSDRLKASLQKNFNLTEDSTIEVEYAISDDTSVRAIKDERGDVGGEIEMRFKF